MKARYHPDDLRYEREDPARVDRSIELGFPLVLVTKGAMIAELGDPRRARDYMLATFSKHRDRLPDQMKSRVVQYLTASAIGSRSTWARWLVWMATRSRVGNPRYLSLSESLMTLWYPTEAARRVRTHPGFPRFAEDIGLVRLWQIHGWPPQVQPKPGTDGSNLQFTCA